ncbi:MAG: DUF916 domain-containing protein, partial [Chloroflexia bacterium]|nr:DUF916 domain-containing protein [Chloroflexia bacterium]
LRSDATATGSVLLRNTGKKPVVIELGVLDARTSQTGGSAFAETGSKPAAVGMWITLAQPKVTLQPGAKKQVGFSIQVPESVEPGQHLAGITAYVVKNPAKDGKQTGASIVVQTRYVIAVQVDVPGTWTPSMKIPAVSLLEQPSGTVIGVSIRNDGDTFVKPSGSMTLSDSTGKRVLDHPIKMDTFVTNTEVTYPVALHDGLKPGKYDVSARLTYAKGKMAEYTGTIEIKAPEQPATAVAAPTRAVGEAQQTPPTGQPSAVVQPAQPPSATTSPIQPWMIYGLGGLLGAIALLLALNLLRGRGQKRSA